MIKKLSIFFAVAAVALGFTGCKDDNDPVYQEPTDATEFKLNTPAFASQFYQLSPDGLMTLTVETQPDYGFVSSVLYSAEISLDKTSVYPVTPDLRTNTVMQLKENDIAVGMCNLAGITDRDGWDANPVAQGVQKLYVRAVAQLSGVESSRVVSNWVELPQVQGFFAIPSPGFIYFIGAASGWKAPSPDNAEALADWRLWESETAIGSGIYSAVFTIPAGQAQFRFYTELTAAGWDNPTGTLGAREENDDNEDITLIDGTYQGSYVIGKGNWQIPEWTEDGELTIVVDTNNKTVQFTKGAQQIYTPRYIYMVGQIAGGWCPPTVANKDKLIELVDKTESDIYTATIDVPAGTGAFNFRFAKDLVDMPDNDAWGAAEWIGCPEGNDFEIDLPYTGQCDAGQNNWKVMNLSDGGKFTVTVDLGAMSVDFAEVTE